MTELLHLAQTDIVYLAPFFNTVFVYFAFVKDPVGELWTTLLKCAPIVSLMVYILLKGFKLSKDYKYSRRILVGLIFSCAGDALLNVDLFPHGMGAFAFAQIYYITAFGWKPLKWAIGLPLYLGGVGLVAICFSKLDEILVIGVPIYATLLLTMCWRSLARAAHKKDTISIFCAIGSVLFVISDGLITLNMFVTELPNARLWIMITYYIAQFAIALSTNNERKSSTTHYRRD